MQTPYTTSGLRKEVDQRFLNNLIQRTSKGDLDWYCEQEPGDIDPHSYFCVYPTRIQIGSDPRNLRAVDIFLYPDNLIVIDAWDAAVASNLRKDPTKMACPPSPILHFTREEYSSHLDRLLALAEEQRVQKNDERHVMLLSNFLKEQD
jgi:hypothetical protein